MSVCVVEILGYDDDDDNDDKVITTFGITRHRCNV